MADPRTVGAGYPADPSNLPRKSSTFSQCGTQCHSRASFTFLLLAELFSSNFGSCVYRWLRGRENDGENRIDMCLTSCQDLLYEDCVPLLVCDDCYDCDACVKKCKQDSEKQCKTECNPDEIYKFAEKQV